MTKREKEEMYDSIWRELMRREIPLLTLDKGWHDIFWEGKTREIEKLEKELNNALKGRGRVNSERAELERLKQILLKQIVENMDAEENSKASKKVEKSKELIEEINDKLILIEDRELDLPDEITEANINLLMEGMSELCGKSISNKEEIAELDRMIEEERIELKRKVLLRQQRIEETERINKYLRKTVGRDMVVKYEEYLKEI